MKLHSSTLCPTCELYLIFDEDLSALDLSGLKLNLAFDYPCIFKVILLRHGVRIIFTESMGDVEDLVPQITKKVLNFINLLQESSGVDYDRKEG